MNKFSNFIDVEKKLKNHITYIIRNLNNLIKIIFNNDVDNFYLPNLGIKNIIMINPNKIRYFNSIPMKFYKSTKFIIDFDWDKENQLIIEQEKEHQVYASCKEIFIDKIPIEKSTMYFYLKKYINHPRGKGCKNHNDIIFFLNNKIKLYENIKKFGFKKNIKGNIEFMVDRNHNLVKINSGNHRFAISRVLKLKKIPVEIKVMHLNCFRDHSNTKLKIQEINKFIKKIENKYA